MHYVVNHWPCFRLWTLWQAKEERRLCAGQEAGDLGFAVQAGALLWSERRAHAVQFIPLDY